MENGTVLIRRTITDQRISERAETIGKYLVDTGCTVRKAASVFGVSKSTVFTDASKRLKKINPVLWVKAQKVLQINKRERHMRGGMVTKMKYSKKK